MQSITDGKNLKRQNTVTNIEERFDNNNPLNMWRSIWTIKKNHSSPAFNDCCPVALTPLIMNCFERILLKHIKDIIPAGLESLQFAYRGH